MAVFWLFTGAYNRALTGASKVQPCHTGVVEEPAAQPGECSFLF